MLSNVLKNFGSLTTMRVLSRLILFVLKTYLIRTQLDDQILAHLLNLDLVLAASLHVARSCFKPSYQKVQNQEHIIKSSMNIMTFGIFATVASAIIVSLMQYYQFINAQIRLINFVDAIALYALSSVCESVAEKYMVECVIQFQYFKIGLVQVISIVPKTCFIFCAAFFNGFQTYGILIFGVGQFLYSVTLMIIFYFLSSNKSLFFQQFQSGKEMVLFDPKSKASLKEFSLLSILKFILQKFQQIVLVFMNFASVSSVYSLINNLGSIIVRYLFSPLNEIGFNHFSRGQKEESINALISFIKSILIFSILVINFGYNYSQTFLTFLYGSKWVTNQSILAMRTYMVLVVFLGLNGVIEAFFFATGRNSINKYNFLSIFTTAFYLAATVFFFTLGFGAAGLFLGNILNMSSRILLCWYLEIRFHIDFPTLLKEIRPSLTFSITSILIFILCHKQYGYALNIVDHNMIKLALGGILFGVNLLPIIFENRQILIKQIQKRFLKDKKE